MTVPMLRVITRSQLPCSHSQEETWPVDARGTLWGISHRRNCHFINPDLVLAYLILAVKYWMTLVLQVETLRTLGEMELGHSVTLQLVLRKLCLGGPGGWGEEPEANLQL